MDTAVVTSTRPSPLPPFVRHGIVMACPPSRWQAAFVISPNGWSKLQDLPSSWPATVPLFLTSSWTDLAPYWERWCTTRLLIAVLDLGSAPSKDTPGAGRCCVMDCSGVSPMGPGGVGCPGLPLTSRLPSRPSLVSASTTYWTRFCLGAVPLRRLSQCGL